MSRLNFNGPPITKLQGSAFRIPTATPESDGTYAWTATTLVLAEASADGRTGIGFSYADAATARLINDRLADVVIGWTERSITQVKPRSGRPARFSSMPTAPMRANRRLAAWLAFLRTNSLPKDTKWP